MEKRIEQELEKLIPDLSEYTILTYSKSTLDSQRVISVYDHNGITQQSTRSERLITLRKGKAVEIDIARQKELKFEYGDFRSEIEAGEPIQKHLKGDEEAVVIIRSEFTTRPKGPHVHTKTIEFYEG